MVHVSLKPGLENFEHYFTSMWDECNCVVVWAFFGIAFLWDWNENWPFPVLWPSSVLSLSCVWCLAIPRTAVCQGSLSITNSQSLLKLMSIKSVMPSNHLILCHPILLPPSIFPSIRVFSNESFLWIRLPNIGVSASASVFPMNIQDWFPLRFLAVQETLKNVLQHYSSKALILQHSAFFIVIHIWLLEKQ